MLPVPTTEPRLDMRTENDEEKVFCGGRMGQEGEELILQRSSDKVLE